MSNEADAYTPAPPPTELQRLAALVGSWRSVHTTVAGPAGPPHQIALGVESFRWLEGGYFLESHYEIQFGEGNAWNRGVMYWCYEPDTGQFHTIFFNDEGNFSDAGNRYVGVCEPGAIVFTGPARFRLPTTANGSVAVTPAGTIEVDWWLPDGNDGWAPWRTVSYEPAHSEG
jgi:hypothetical protein